MTRTPSRFRRATSQAPQPRTGATRALVTLTLAATLFACGPSGGGSAVSHVLSDGRGEPVVQSLSHTPGLRFEATVTGKDAPANGNTWFAPPITLENGVTVAVLVTGLQDVYLEYAATGRYYWGANDEGVLDTPLLEVKLPLRDGTEWETGDAKTPNWYRYRVEAVEPLEVAAGTFTTARLLQINTKTGDRVTRWYADRVGLVAREGNGLVTRLVSVTAPGEGK